MTIELEEIAKSKIYVSANQLTRFEHPMFYIEKFIDNMKSIPDAVIEYKAILPVSNANEEDGELNVAYPRISVLAKIPQNRFIVPNTQFGVIDTTIGIVYALDTQKPEMTVFRGNEVEVCANGAIFGANNIARVLLREGVGVIYDLQKDFIRTVNEYSRESEKHILNLNSKQYDSYQLNEQIGKIVREASLNKKLGVTIATGMVKNIQDSKSIYALNQDDSISSWKLFNAATEEIKKSSISEQPSKLLAIQKLFLN